MKSGHRPKGSPITSTPTIRKYADGYFTVWKDSRGKVHRRKTGHPNPTDINAPIGSIRIEGYGNTTDASRKSNYYI